MDEYIKREDVIRHLRGACIAKYPLSFSYGIFASADEISKLPPADVVPKGEDDWGSIPVDVSEALKQRAVEKAKAEVTREIFEEIEAKITAALKNNYAKRNECNAETDLLHTANISGRIACLRGLADFVAELKKKY